LRVRQWEKGDARAEQQRSELWKPWPNPGYLNVGEFSRIAGLKLEDWEVGK